MTTPSVTRPRVLFVCIHNAGRSQMAAGYLQHLAGDRIEEGIDIAHETPKKLTDAAVREADVVIAMGCGDACPFYPGKRYEDWLLDDPAGQPLDLVRPIRDQIRHRVEQLIASLDATRLI